MRQRDRRAKHSACRPAAKRARPERCPVVVGSRTAPAHSRRLRRRRRPTRLLIRPKRRRPTTTRQPTTAPTPGRSASRASSIRLTGRALCSRRATDRWPSQSRATSLFSSPRRSATPSTNLVVGADVTAVLARTEAGVVARNVAIGGAGTGGLGFGGGGRQGGGAGANVVTGTIASVGGGTLVIETAEGPVEVVLADDTPVLITRSFADAAGDLPQGTEITVVGQRTDDGELQAIAVTTGAPGPPRGGAGRGGRGGQ